MWIFRSIELLPRPTFLGLAPTAAMLAVWTLFENTEPTLFAREVQPLWLALVTYFALTYAARLPALFARGDVSKGARGELVGIVAGSMVLVAAGVFVTDPWILQLGWIIGWLGYTTLFLVTLLLFNTDDLALLPFRWAADHPFSREAMWIVAVRLAVVAVLVSFVTVYGTLSEFVWVISLGRIALFYIFEWVTILFALTWRGHDG